MRTVNEILKIAKEFHSPEVTRLEMYLGPRGRKNYRHSTRWNELAAQLREDRIFCCSECGRMYAYADLEAWTCNFEDLEDGIICSSCYENEMGEDL